MLDLVNSEDKQTNGLSADSPKRKSQGYRKGADTSRG
jgi:hypothetical protein